MVNGVETELQRDPTASISRLGSLTIVRTSDGIATGMAVRVGDVTHVSFQGQVYRVEKAGTGRKGAVTRSTGDTLAPMPGLVVEVYVEKGQQVNVGQRLLVLEAMKMQHTVSAPFEGTVSELPVSKGDQVGEGQLLVHVEAIHE